MRRHWYSLLGATLMAASVGTTAVNGPAGHEAAVNDHKEPGIVVKIPNGANTNDAGQIVVTDNQSH